MPTTTKEAAGAKEAAATKQAAGAKEAAGRSGQRTPVLHQPRRREATAGGRARPGPHRTAVGGTRASAARDVLDAAVRA